MAESTALRLERARSALALAEEAVGVRHTALGRSSPSSASPLDAPEWPVPPALASLFPTGLRRGMSLSVHGPPLALMLLASIPSRAGAYLACFGWESMGWASAAHLGMNLERTVAIRAPHGSNAGLVSAAIDGCDVVMLGPDMRIDARERRLLARRALTRGSLILAHAPQGQAQLSARYVGVEGLGQGHGHISAVFFDFSRPPGKPIRLRIDTRGWNVIEALKVVPS